MGIDWVLFLELEYIKLLILGFEYTKPIIIT